MNYILVIWIKMNSMTPIKTIIKDKPLPTPLKKAIQDKQVWIKKVQSGQIKSNKTKLKLVG